MAVPYFIHREDAKRIAPLWVKLTKKVHAVYQKPGMQQKWHSLQPGWCAEMHAFNFAAAELGIRFNKMPKLQIRDVDGKISYAHWARERLPIAMIHVGRAWFPRAYVQKHTPQWYHTEGHSLRPRNTEQVWCKCNYTAADVRPWPLPPTPIDFVSNITLTYLHESMVKYGNPKPNKYRGDAVRHRHGGYSRSFE